MTEQLQHCPDCQDFSRNENAERGEGAQVEYEPSCKDSSCLCHAPLQVNVQEETQAKAIFGKLPSS